MCHHHWRPLPYETAPDSVNRLITDCMAGEADHAARFNSATDCFVALADPADRPDATEIIDRLTTEVQREVRCVATPYMLTDMIDYTGEPG